MNDHPYLDEVKFSLELLNNQGFVPIGYDDGDGVLNTTKDIDTIVEAVLSVDESWVEFEYDGKHVTAFFVLGNEPGVAIADYSYLLNDKNHIMDKFDGIIETIYNHFNP
jgi:hypothetical protein